MCNFALKDNPVTCADFAFNAIAKQTKKIVKYEKKILTENDPENLHQIRVAMRRLRSVLSVFSIVLKMPSTISDKKIGNLARILGQQRDLDILKINLENKFSHHFLEEEKVIIEKIIHKITQLSNLSESQNLQAILTSKKYQNLKEDLISWLENPQFSSIESQYIKNILPDLLLPQISNFFLQSGWLIGTLIEDNGQISIQENLSNEEINILINKQGENLHKLRKQAKKTRYQLELFREFYPESYTEYLDYITQIQDILGDIQDNLCLQEHLKEIMGDKWQKKLSNLHTLIIEDKLLKWQQWQTLQTRFFVPDFCYNFRRIINEKVNTIV